MSIGTLERLSLPTDANGEGVRGYNGLVQIYNKHTALE